MTPRPFSLHAAERRATSRIERAATVAVILAVVARRRFELTRYRAADLRALTRRTR